MSRVFPFRIQRWSAWASGMHSKNDWCQWAKDPQLFGVDEVPKLAFLDPMLRRRCRKLTKAMLEVAYPCLLVQESATTPTVFASRYGEAETTVSLLRDLVHEKPLSPTSFGLSVHNTASGVFGIFAHNREPSTTISAGSDTFCYGFLEALLQISSANKSTLLVMADEPVDEIYQPYLDTAQTYYALGLLLHPAQERSDLVLEISPCHLSDPSASELPQGLTFLAWLLSAEQSLTLRTKGYRWHFTKEGADLFERFRMIHEEKT